MWRSRNLIVTCTVTLTLVSSLGIQSAYAAGTTSWEAVWVVGTANVLLPRMTVAAPRDTSVAQSAGTGSNRSETSKSALPQSSTPRDDAPSTVDDLMQRQPPKPQPQVISFWDAVRAKASNKDEGQAVSDVQDLIERQRQSFDRWNNPHPFRCSQLQGTGELFQAAEALVTVTLPNTQDPSALKLFQNSFRSFSTLCPSEVSRGKAFLDELAKILTAARSARIELQNKERIAKEEAASAAAERMRIQREQDRAAEAARREADTHARDRDQQWREYAAGGKWTCLAKRDGRTIWGPREWTFQERYIEFYEQQPDGGILAYGASLPNQQTLHVVTLYLRHGEKIYGAGITDRHDSGMDFHIKSVNRSDFELELMSFWGVAPIQIIGARLTCHRPVSEAASPVGKR